MSQGVRVERVTALPAGLGALIAESLEQDFRAVERLRDAWEAGDNRFDRAGEALFTAHVDGALAGVCGLNRDPYLEEGTTGRVRHLYVGDAQRRRGVGRMLVSAVLRHAHGHFDRVRLRTLQGEATRFYDALGFERTPDEAASTHALAPPFFVSRVQPMAPRLHAFLEGRTPDCAQPVAFGPHALQLCCYLTRDAPPEELVLAGRAVVCGGGRVLVSQNRDGRHVLPGGRLEPGESAEDAVRRELLEETGWEVGELSPLAVVHAYTETPEPTNVGRVIHPDFIWQIFRAAPRRQRPEAKLSGDYELGAELVPVEEAERIVELALERTLLQAIRSQGRDT